MPFTDAPTEFKRTNLFVDISGEEKTGKTTLALSARPLMSVIDMNDGLDGVIQKVVRRAGLGKIKTAYHPLPQYDTKENMQQVAKKTLDAIIVDIKSAATKGGSVLLDTGTELYKLSRYVAFGGLKTESRKGQLDYEMSNSIMRGIYHLFHAYKANFIVTHQVREEWISYKDSNGVEKRKTTGKMVNNGWEDTGYDIQIALRTEKRITAEDGLHFVAILKTCRFDPKLEGTEFSSVVDQFNLPFIMSYVTDTEIGVWER